MQQDFVIKGTERLRQIHKNWYWQLFVIKNRKHCQIVLLYPVLSNGPLVSCTIPTGIKWIVWSKISIQDDFFQISSIYIVLYNGKTFVICIFTRGQFSPGIVVACVCLCVRVSVCVCVARQTRDCLRHNSSPLELWTPNWYHMCKTYGLRSPLFLGGNWYWPSRTNLTLQSKFTPFWHCPHHNSSPI